MFFCTCRVWLWVCILNGVLTVTIAQPVCNNSFASISILCHLAGDIPLGNKWFILCSDSLTVQFSHLIVLTWMHTNMKKNVNLHIEHCKNDYTLSLSRTDIFFPLRMSLTSDKCIHLMQHSLLSPPQCEHLHSLFRQHTALK